MTNNNWTGAALSLSLSRCRCRRFRQSFRIYYSLTLLLFRVRPSFRVPLFAFSLSTSVTEINGTWLRPPLPHTVACVSERASERLLRQSHFFRAQLPLLRDTSAIISFYRITAANEMTCVCYGYGRSNSFGKDSENHCCGLLQLCRKSQLAEHEKKIEKKSGRAEQWTDLLRFFCWRADGGWRWTQGLSLPLSLSPPSNFSPSVRGKLT